MSATHVEGALRRQVRTLTIQLQAAESELRWPRVVLADDDVEVDADRDLPLPEPEETTP
jgi:hypothetical protein